MLSSLFQKRVLAKKGIPLVKITSIKRVYLCDKKRVYLYDKKDNLLSDENKVHRGDEG